MEQPHTVSAANASSREDLERHIARVRAEVQRPLGGIFGAESASWRINRESALFLGAGRAALLQLAHPWVATALDQHSSLMEKPIERFHNTFRIVFTMIFGTADQAFRVARGLHQMHTRITGTLPATVAGYAEGSRYEALHTQALVWVYATLVESAVFAYECVLPPLGSDELATYYAESKVLAGLFGIAPQSLPRDWDAFKRYIADMCASHALGVSERARYMAQRIMTGAGSWVPVPGWYRALTAEWLPERFREEFAVAYGPKERQSGRRARRWLERAYRKLPEALRYVGPYHEALARLNGEKPGVIARRANVFWIGQARMPFGE